MEWKVGSLSRVYNMISADKKWNKTYPNKVANCEINSWNKSLDLRDCGLTFLIMIYTAQSRHTLCEREIIQSYMDGLDWIQWNKSFYPHKVVWSRIVVLIIKVEIIDMLP